MPNNNRNLSRSIFRAAQVLSCINEGIVGVTTIANTLNLNKATVYRILKSLEGAGLVTQSLKNKKYYLGHLINKLASNPLVSHQLLINCTLDEMRRLRDKYQETLCLEIPTGMNGMFIEVIESNQSVRHTMEVGNCLPLNIGSGGKVLLSQSPKKELEVFFKCAKLIKVGPNAITNEAELRDAIKETREMGYATSHSEGSIGGVGIAVPVYEYVCPVALIIVGPENRFDDVKIAQMIKDLKKSSHLISSKLTTLADL
jgi:IclR family KDG regulon transcriptional repressor